MRKDVHIGLAIGGVLLAVLIVWGIVVSGTRKQVKSVTLDTTTDKSSPSSSGNDIPPPLTAAPAADDPLTAPPMTPAPAPTPAPAAAPAAPPKADWLALMAGKISLDPEPLKTETPAPADAAKPVADSAAPAPAVDLPAGPLASAAAPDSQTLAAPASPAPVDPAPPAPATATGGDAKPAAARTHTVQRGETFSSIAKAVYGEARYYQQIAKANPKIDPSRLRPGTVITLPEISEAKSSAKANAPAALSPQSAAKPQPSAAPAVDSQKEYRVAAGDSLYRICMRLYGSGEETDHLYDLNKSTIGPDRAKLKVGMVLKIPAPPSVATASR